jgi:hypothetical protein
VRSKIRTAFSTKINAVGLPIIALCWVCFFGNYVDRFKEGVRHMPALQLAGIRQFIGGILYVSFSCTKKEGLRKTMENNHHFKYS